MSKILTREEYERTWAHIREFLRQRGDYPAVGSSALAALDKGDAALRERVAELERVIGDAPHETRCRLLIQDGVQDCNCFKAKAKVSG